MSESIIVLNARGRMSRRRFTRAYIAYFGVSMLSGVIPILGPLLNLAATYMTICVQARRLHDFGRSGWLQLLSMVPWAVWVFARAFHVIGQAPPGKIDPMILIQGMTPASPWTWTMVLAAINQLVFVVWLMRTPGDPGPNRHGEATASAPTSTLR